MQRILIGLLVLFTLGVLCVSSATEAQPSPTVSRVGWLSAGSPHGDPGIEAFRQGLRALGYLEGETLILEARYAVGSAERLPTLAAELVQRQVDVIVAGGSAAIRAAQQATPTIPIVMAVAYDPIGQGFIASLAQPGRNITGLSWWGAELVGKRLELLKETVP